MSRSEDKRIARGMFDAKCIYDSIFKCHEIQRKSGSLCFTDLDYLQLQRNGAWDVLSEWGNSILEGKDIINLEFPIEFFEPRSALERLMIGFCFAPTFLTPVARLQPNAEQSASDICLARFKNVILFVLAGLHLTPTQRSPFNPILGETFQATYTDGTQIYVEQISHHPPISRWQMTSPSGDFKFSGQVLWSVSGLGNSMRSQQKGECMVEFLSSGQRVIVELPQVSIGGLLWGDRTYDLVGSLKVNDELNQLSCEVVFNPDGKGSWIKKLFRSIKPQRSMLRGNVLRSGLEICVVEGNWLSHIDIGGLRLWTMATEWEDASQRPHSIVPLDNPLCTDSRFREDIQALFEGDLERAEELKCLVEEKQRYLRKTDSANANASNILRTDRSPMKKHNVASSSSPNSAMTSGEASPNKSGRWKRRSIDSTNTTFFDAVETPTLSRKQSIERLRVEMEKSSAL